MIILAVSTSAKYPSAALCSDSDSSRRTIIVQTDESGKPHSVSLMPLIDSMLEKAGLQLSDIDLFAVDAGPGSFTGVRIGVTTVNAFAYAEKKPIAAVSSLAALRHAAQGRFGNRILCMLDARNGNGYAAVYEGEECIVPPCACVQKEMLDSLSGTEYHQAIKPIHILLNHLSDRVFYRLRIGTWIGSADGNGRWRNLRILRNR